MHFTTTLVSTVSALALVSSAFPIGGPSVEPSGTDTTSSVVYGPGGFKTTAQYQRRQDDANDSDSNSDADSDLGLILGPLLELLQPLLNGVNEGLDQGSGVAIANAGSAVQDTVHAVQSNQGLAGDIITTLTGRGNGNSQTKERRQEDSDSDNEGGLEALTAPLVDGVANPLTTGLGRGVAGAAAGTQQTADLLGDAIAALFHVIGGVAANTEQGAGVAVANAASAVQDTVSAIQNNKGLAGDIVNTVAGSRRRQEGGGTSQAEQKTADLIAMIKKTAEALMDAVDNKLGDVRDSLTASTQTLQDAVSGFDQNNDISGDIVKVVTGREVAGNGQAKHRRELLGDFTVTITVSAGSITSTVLQGAEIQVGNARTKRSALSTSDASSEPAAEVAENVSESEELDPSDTEESSESDDSVTEEQEISLDDILKAYKEMLASLGVPVSDEEILAFLNADVR